MRKPMVFFSINRAKDGTVLSRSKGEYDGHEMKTVGMERLVSPEYRQNHTKNCVLLIEAACQKEDWVI